MNSQFATAEGSRPTAIIFSGALLDVMLPTVFGGEPGAADPCHSPMPPHGIIVLELTVKAAV